MELTKTIFRRKARYVVSRAVFNGQITRPSVCEQCGSGSSRIEAHHDDYARPLDVKWLCLACHGRTRTGEIRTKSVVTSPRPQVQTIECPKCKHEWAARKSGGAKKCPRCQSRLVAKEKAK